MALVEVGFQDPTRPPAFSPGVKGVEVRTGDLVATITEWPNGGIEVQVAPQVEGLELEGPRLEALDGGGVAIVFRARASEAV